MLSVGSKLSAAEIAPCRDEQEERIMAEVIKYVYTFIWIESY